MARRDDLHFPVRRALEKDGWRITHDPLELELRGSKLQADLGAEHTLAAEKEGRKIAVEIKDFDGASATGELERTLGQMQLYQWALDEQEPDRALFLAISHAAYYRIFQRPMFQLAVQRNRLSLIIVDEINEEVLQWIKTINTPTS